MDDDFAYTLEKLYEDDFFKMKYNEKRFPFLCDIADYGTGIRIKK
jgi:hypothetical protein